MKYIFVVNPVAGKKQVQYDIVNQIKLKLTEDQYEIYQTKGPNDARLFCSERVKTKEDLIFFACGGDGTVFEVVNGVGLKFPVGVIPCGSGNDFIKNIENTDFLSLARQLNGTIEEMDLLVCNGEYVCNTFSTGFDADIAYNMVKYKSKPFVSGNGAYLLSLIGCFSHRLSYPMKIYVDGSETPIDENLLFCLCANGYIYGGSFKAAPFAYINDGFIDLCYCKELKKSDVLKLVKGFKDGNHVSDPRFKQFIGYQKCTKLRIEFPKPTIAGFDGNCTKLNSIDIEILPKAMKLLVPHGGRIRSEK